jgi:hypothetical protein
MDTNVEIESSVSRKRRIEMEDLSNVEFETSEEVDVVPSFDKMGLNKLKFLPFLSLF